MSAIQKLLTDHIDIWTAAETEKKSGRGRSSGNAGNVYGIKKLRELILELAVRGKLVPQDANDEPASELLKRIQAEKAKLVTEGKALKNKPLPPIIEEEKPFGLPLGWNWSRLGSVSIKITDGEHISPNKTSSGMPLLTAKDVTNDGVIIDSPQYVSLEDGPRFRSRCDPERGDVLICSRGTIGRCAAVEIDEVFCLMGSVILVKTSKNIYYKYIVRYLQTEIAQKWMRGASSATAVSALYLKDVTKCLVPLPSIAEQQRIVAKVDELMALCDQLENQHSNAAEAHEQLVNHLLGTLTQSPVRGEPVEPHPSTSSGRTEFEDNWQRIAAHFDTLFTTETSIDALKQTLLQLAVMGKLVLQDPNDEPASELVRRVFAEKNKLLAEKKYQKTGKLNPKGQMRKYPENWVVVQIGEICPSVVPSRDKPKTFSGEIPWITLPSFPSDKWYLDTSNVDLGLTIEEANKYSARVIPVNSVLMSCIGRFGLTAINQIPVIPNQQIHALIVLNGVVPEFLSVVIRVSGKQMEEMATSTTIAYLNKSNCESIEFGLPPEAEQHRIIAKVDELMALCDQLKSRISESMQLQQKLADVLVEQAVSQ